MEPTVEVTQATILSETTSLMDGKKEPAGLVVALQPLVDSGKLVFYSDNGPGIPGVENTYALPPAQGEPFASGKKILETSSYGGETRPYAFTTFSYDMNGRPTQVSKSARSSDGHSWMVTDTTTYEYHPNGTLARKERNWRKGSEWQKDIETFDNQGAPVSTT